MPVPDRPRHVLAAGVVLALATLPTTAALALAWFAVGTLPQLRAADRSLADLVLTLALAGTAGLCLWLAGTVLLSGVDALGERRDPAGRRGPSRPPRPGTRAPHPPAAIRRLVSLAVGAALGSGVVAANAAPPAPEPSWPVSAPAVAGPSTDGRVTDGPSTDGSASNGSVSDDIAAPGWSATGSTVAGRARTAVPALADRLGATPGSHVVLRGDTLWDIAAARLGRDAAGPEVHAEVLRLHAANRAVIGADPDVLLPGQILRLP